MSRDELHNLTARLAARQAAHAERLTHERRGGPRQPGTRGGVFPQKISNSERVLLTVLYLRKMCTLEVLAEALGDVSRSAIGGVVRETQPMLVQDGVCRPQRSATIAVPPSSSPQHPRRRTRREPTHRQVDSLQLHLDLNALPELPTSVAEFPAWCEQRYELLERRLAALLSVDMSPPPTTGEAYD